MTKTDKNDASGEAACSPQGGGDSGNDETQAYYSANDIVRILDEYLEALKAGNAPSRDELITKYPELREQLDACLAGLTFLHANHGSNVPSQLGDFRIVREVGRGGMGAVFEAIQISLGRRVALKVLRFGAASDKEAIERFQREAETVATLHHTNIVPIYFVGSEKGVNYYAMQFIEGRNLAEITGERDAEISVTQVANWALQAAEALSHAHRRGVIHRDVKPSNLILDKDDRLWLTDFGLARRQDDVTLSLTGMLLGTPRYMSPEHASASSKRIDHRSDLFSLGATLYELLTRQPAFKGDAAHDVIHQILVDQPTPIGQLNPNVPRDFETIVMKCMAKEPGARYASADDLAADLRALIEDRPIRARRASVIEHAMRWVKQNQRAVTQLSTAVMLTLTLTLTSLLIWNSYHSWNAAALRLSALSPPLVAEIFGDDGKSIRTETLPMQNAVELAAGQYDLRISAEGTFSQDVRVALDRGDRSAKYTVNVSDQWLTTPESIEHSYDSFDLGSVHAIVRWGNSGIAVRKIEEPSFPWSLDLSPETQPALKGYPAYLNPKRSTQQASGGFGESNESRPWTLREFVDVNQDGVGDYVCAARHQAWVMAVSGKGDGILWFSGLSEELATAPATAPAQSPLLGSMQSAVVAAPEMCSDLDGDGARDFVVSLVAPLSSSQPQGNGNDRLRALAAISTRTGKVLWRYEIPESCFALSANQEVPYDLRWFGDAYGGHSSRGGQTMYLGNHHYRIPPYYALSGGHVYLPTSPKVLRAANGKQEVISLVAGDHLLQVDAITGKPIDAPKELGFRPGADVQWADMDGDGETDLIAIEEIPTQPNELPRPKLIVWSLAKRQLLWSKPLDAYWPRGISKGLSRPTWPLITDLNADGKCEVIVPHGRSHTPQSINSAAFALNVPRGKLTVLEGESGVERWTQTIIALDATVDYFIDGPDLNEDGVRDLFAATFDSTGDYLQVDALSGTSGTCLWGNRQKIDAESFDKRRVVGLRKWRSGPDGWPHLLVTLADHKFWLGQEFNTSVIAFSTGTGQVHSIGQDINECTPIDLDHDGAEDLIVCSRVAGDNHKTVHTIRGVLNQPWKRLGDMGRVTADLDGDHVLDTVASWGDGTLIATSGATGDRLWRSRVIRTAGQLRVRIPSESIPSQFSTRRTTDTSDLNGDGIDDLIVFDTQTSGQKKIPIHAVSGRTGILLWSLQNVWVQSISDILATSIADIDQDGEPELICMAALDYGYPASSTPFSNQNVQLWMFVARGKSGELVWSKSLSPAYGMHGTMSPMQLSDLSVDLAFADLNSDQVSDFIVPAIRDDGSLETQVLNGRDGEMLWVRSRQNDGLSKQSLENWIAPSFSDFDGNGLPEVVMVEPLAQPPSASSQRIEVAVTLLDTQGNEQWMIPTGSRYTHFNSFAQHKGALLRPLVIHASTSVKTLATRTSRVALVLPSDASLISIDRNGKFIQRVLGSRLPQTSKLFAMDADADGSEELFFVERDSVVAVRAEKLDETRWSYALGQIEQHRLLGVIEASGNRPPLVIAQTDCTRNSVIALDATKGKPIWICSGPVARAADMTSYVEPQQVVVLGSTDDELPLVLFKYDYVSDCRQAIPSALVASDTESQVTMLAVHRATAHVTGIHDDPRWKRPLPWSAGFVQDAHMFQYVLWGCFFAMTIVLMPLIYLYQLIARHRFALRYLLLLPLLAAIFLQATLISGPDDHEFSNFANRMSIAFVFAPPLFALGMLAWWTWQKERRRVAYSLIGIVVCSLLIAGISIAVSLRNAPLIANQHFDWSDWYLVLLPAAYAVSWLMIGGCLIQWLVNRLGNVLVRRVSARVSDGGVSTESHDPVSMSASALPSSNV